MPKVSRWRLFWTIVSIGAAVYVVLNNPVNLGLDLRGGTQIVLEAQDTPDVTVDSDVTARTLEVLRRRVDAIGVAEPRHAVVASVIAGALAVTIPHLRRAPMVEP